MPALAAFALANLKHDLEWAWDWLTHATTAQLVALALAIFATVQHFELVHERHVAATYLKQRDYYKAAIDDADKAVRKAQAEMNQVSKLLKERTDEKNRRIAGDADRLRMSGPGKALCRPASPSAGGDKASPIRNAPGPSLSPDDRAAVPWNWLTDRAQEHDQLRSEVQAWHDWYQKLVENWPKH